MALRRHVSIFLVAVFVITSVLSFSFDSKNNKAQAAVKPKVFTMFSADASVTPHPDLFSSKIGQEITKRTGVRLKVEYLVGLDQATKVSLMLASGDLPDFVYGSGEHQQFIRAGAVVPLEDYINKYGKYSKQIYSDSDFKKLTLTDGHIYFLSYNRNEVSPSTKGDYAFWTQIEALKEAGYPTFKYWEDYVPFIKNYVKKHPTTDGAKTIGLTITTEGARFYMITNPPKFLMGSQDDGAFIVNQKTYEAKMFAMSSGAYKFYKSLNSLWQEGILDKEMFVQSHDQYLAKIAQGRVVSTFGRNFHLTNTWNSLRQQGKFSKAPAVPFPLVFKGTKRSRYLMVSTIGTRDGISISKKCKDPVAAFKFLDALCQVDIQKLMYWGIKGQDYTVENGKMTVSQKQMEMRRDPVYQKKQGIGYWEIFPHAYLKLQDGNYRRPEFDPEIAYRDYTKEEKEVLDAYKFKSFMQFYDPPEQSKYGYAWEISVPSDRQDITVGNQKRDDLSRKYIPQLVMAPKGRFDDLWKRYVNDMNKTNPKAAEEFYTQQIKWRLDKWY
ncbi:ABC transporter substrate-binding protein [Caldicellulosiruptoraceae bacterium PP1]